MIRVVSRVVGVLLALAGLALAAVGVWFAVQLGGTGTATFTTSPGTARPVVIPPSVLNRVDADVTVTATPGAGGRVWMALANPSDATAVVGDAEHVVATGVDVRDWRLLTTSEGSGPAGSLADAELWRDQDDAEEPVSMTVDQADAPESVVIVAEEGTVATVTMTINDKTWFVESVVVALVGIFVLVVGLVLAWPRRHRRTPSTSPTPAATPEQPTPDEDPVTTENSEGAADPEPADGSEGAADPEPADETVDAGDSAPAPEPASEADTAPPAPTDLPPTKEHTP